MIIRFIVAGRPARDYALLIRDYEKRLSSFCRFERVEVRSEKNIPSKLKGFVVVCSQEGVQMSSREFAQFLKGKQEVSFVVGPAQGLSDSVKLRAQKVVSLSSMTLPHDMAHLVLAEQVYRAFTILKGRKYHK